ncbi:MAG: NAD(P)/FAD-dependent oxidoreductase, partial [Chloroflexi bacterium]|nr:NAD(P)/FAD-dependent oxidoreductase [Chloroflexota bacterium]
MWPALGRVLRDEAAGALRSEQVARTEKVGKPTVSDYDVVVIGAGSAGVWAAPFAARLGARVALIEKERIGGDCTLFGCVPSKAFLQAARVAW